MPIRKPKPTSPGRRFVSYPDFAEVTTSEPEKTLVEGLHKSGGRNAHGRKTARHRGGGAKRSYRRIDFKRRKDSVTEKENAKAAKPGRKSRRGGPPQTRRSAMHPVDHPHGGGEASTPAGRHPVTPGGVPTLGYRTRKRNKRSDAMIVRARRRGKGKQ